MQKTDVTKTSIHGGYSKTSENKVLFVENERIKKPKILIVEDDKNSKFVLKEFTIHLSKEILQVNTGLEAVEMCRQNPDIDLVLMDIQLPELNGYETTRQIREFNKDVVIIAQTAFAQESDKEMAMAAGCNDYISKPFKHVNLTEIIKKYFADV
ncbi:MAG TPA: response regulator [Bacteroidales bacterium]|nr:response regulator [Bacteroidales bacterium]